MEYIKDPKMIEVRSFEIIQGIIDDIRPGYKFKNEIEEKIIKRCIHTSADFEYLDILKISETAVQKIIDALNNKCTIYTDTNMALSGINKSKLNDLGCEYKCLVADERTKDASGSLYSYTFLRAEMRLLRLLFPTSRRRKNGRVRPRRERPSGRSSAPRRTAHCGYRLFRRRHTVLSRSQTSQGTPFIRAKALCPFQGC